MNYVCTKKLKHTKNKDKKCPKFEFLIVSFVRIGFLMDGGNDNGINIVPCLQGC